MLKLWWVKKGFKSNLVLGKLKIDDVVELVICVDFEVKCNVGEFGIVVLRIVLKNLMVIVVFVVF